MMLGQDDSDGGYLTQCIASMVMLVRIDFEVRNGPSLALVCNIRRGATKLSFVCTTVPIQRRGRF